MQEYTYMQITPLDPGKVPSHGNDPMFSTQMVRNKVHLECIH